MTDIRIPDRHNVPRDPLAVADYIERYRAVPDTVAATRAADMIRGLHAKLESATADAPPMTCGRLGCGEQVRAVRRKWNTYKCRCGYSWAESRLEAPAPPADGERPVPGDDPTDDQLRDLFLQAICGSPSATAPHWLRGYRSLFDWGKRRGATVVLPPEPAEVKANITEEHIRAFLATDDEPQAPAPTAPVLTIGNPASGPRWTCATCKHSRPGSCANPDRVSLDGACHSDYRPPTAPEADRKLDRVEADALACAQELRTQIAAWQAAHTGRVPLHGYTDPETWSLMQTIAIVLRALPAAEPDGREVQGALQAMFDAGVAKGRDSAVPIIEEANRTVDKFMARADKAEAERDEWRRKCSDARIDAKNAVAKVAELEAILRQCEPTLCWLLPTHKHWTDRDGKTQDPCGVNAAYEAVRAALSREGS